METLSPWDLSACAHCGHLGEYGTLPYCGKKFPDPSQGVEYLSDMDWRLGCEDIKVVIPVNDRVPRYLELVPDWRGSVLIGKEGLPLTDKVYSQIVDFFAEDKTALPL
ncbi:MAG: hypothetical protein Q7S44_01810 [bacterium]|nr:hypothetical protein [bacterium]